MTTPIFHKGKCSLNGVTKRRLPILNTRSVYIFDNGVVKLDPQRTDKRGQCRREAQLWASLDNEDRQYFAPVLNSGTHRGRTWVVQQRVKFSPPTSRDLFVKVGALALKHDISQTLSELAVDDGEGPLNTVGWEAEGWAVSETGEPIFFDYGA